MSIMGFWFFCFVVFPSLFTLKAGISRLFIFRYMIASNTDHIANHGEVLISSDYK
jgi:hypothetical protein